MKNALVVGGILLVITSTLVFLVCHNGVLHYETDAGRVYSANNPEAEKENNIFIAMRLISALFVLIEVSMILYGFYSEKRNSNQHPTSNPDGLQTQKLPK